MTIQERKYLCSLVEDLINYVPASEQWRVKGIKKLVGQLLRELYFDEERAYWNHNE